MNCEISISNCSCFYCSRVQYGCKRDTPNRCNENYCGLDVVCSQSVDLDYYINQCKRFGRVESDVGSCIDCSMENKDLFYACRDVGYLKSKPKKEENNIEFIRW